MREAIFITSACAIINKKMKKRYQFVPSVPISKYIFYYFNFPRDRIKNYIRPRWNYSPRLLLRRLTWFREVVCPEESSTVLPVSNRLCHRPPWSSSPSARRSLSWDRSDRVPRPRDLEPSRWTTRHGEIILRRETDGWRSQDSRDLFAALNSHDVRIEIRRDIIGFRSIERKRRAPDRSSAPNERLLSSHG